jgi:hypothetical protein
MNSKGKNNKLISAKNENKMANYNKYYLDYNNNTNTNTNGNINEKTGTLLKNISFVNQNKNNVNNANKVNPKKRESKNNKEYYNSQMAKKIDMPNKNNSINRYKKNNAEIKDNKNNNNNLNYTINRNIKNNNNIININNNNSNFNNVNDAKLFLKSIKDFLFTSIKEINNFENDSLKIYYISMQNYFSIKGLLISKKYKLLNEYEFFQKFNSEKEDCLSKQIINDKKNMSKAIINKTENKLFNYFNYEILSSKNILRTLSTLGILSLTVISLLYLRKKYKK